MAAGRRTAPDASDSGPPRDRDGLRELNQLSDLVNVERDQNPGTILIGATYFEYDLNGNTVQRVNTDQNGDITGATYCAWDSVDQLTEVRTLAGVDNAFSYDGGFQRVQRQDAEGTKKYNWDGLNVLLERDGSNDTTSTHTHGPVPIAGIGTLLTTRQQGAVPEDVWYHHDAIGSTRQLSDTPTPAAVTRQNLLDAWGNLVSTAGIDDTPYRFTGKETDPDTNLIYSGRRYYDPTIGRWLNRDPARDGMNWYEYAGSSPTGRVDAEGLQDSTMEWELEGARRRQRAEDAYAASLRSLYGGVSSRSKYLDYQLEWGVPLLGGLPDPLRPLTAEDVRTATRALKIGDLFHLPHPWVVAAVWRYETAWRERPWVEDVAAIQDWRASMSPAGAGTIGPLQLSAGTMEQIERKLHDPSNRAPADSRRLLPAVTGGTRDEQLRVRTGRALSLEWSLRYLAAWVWLFEQQIPLHNRKHPGDRWQTADFVPQYWNRNPGAGFRGALQNPISRQHYKQLWWLSVGGLGDEFMRLERQIPK